MEDTYILVLEFTAPGAEKATQLQFKDIDPNNISADYISPQVEAIIASGVVAVTVGAEKVAAASCSACYILVTSIQEFDL